jgi:flagellar protein FlaG
VVDFFQRVQQTASASPARLLHDPNTPAATALPREPESDAAGQAQSLKVEDKVELQIEPEAVRQLQPNTHLKFVISEDSSRVIVQIIQSDTNTVLREVPPKSLTEALAALNGGFAK